LRNQAIEHEEKKMKGEKGKAPAVSASAEDSWEGLLEEEEEVR